MSYKIATAEKDAVIFQVNSKGVLMCCRWTIYHFMKTHPNPSPQVMSPGLAIECVGCGAHLEVVQDSFVLGPNWEWKKPIQALGKEL